MHRSGKSISDIVTRSSQQSKTNPAAAHPASTQGRPAGRPWFRLLVIALIFVQILPANWQAPPNSLDRSLEAATAGYRFNLAAWELNAISGKLQDLGRRPAAGLSPEQEQAVVRSYLQIANDAGALEDQIERIYADPNQADPEAASEALRAELAKLRTTLAEQADTVEAVLESQISRIMAADRLTTAGLIWPPPRFSFTEPPQLLVISPRERIERLRSIDLQSHLDSADRNRIEQNVARENNLSAYITTIGGYGVWPTMVVDRYGLVWTLETIAHEWVHNYLAFHRLGWAYLAGGDAVTINETVASIVGKELGLAALETYYPDLIPPPPAPPGETAEPQEPPEPPSFDYGQEMRATRLAVDALLAKGYIKEAEAFMEARRQTFVAHGYRLRVLNQAYFAFHGSYATGPAGVDPIGPKLQALRDLSPSLADFLRTVDGITTVTQIDAALASAP